MSRSLRTEIGTASLTIKRLSFPYTTKAVDQGLLNTTFVIPNIAPGITCNAGETCKKQKGENNK